jgi:wee1-like protein kinase
MPAKTKRKRQEHTLFPSLIDSTPRNNTEDAVSNNRPFSWPNTMMNPPRTPSPKRDLYTPSPFPHRMIHSTNIAPFDIADSSRHGGFTVEGNSASQDVHMSQNASQMPIMFSQSQDMGADFEATPQSYPIVPVSLVQINRELENQRAKIKSSHLVSLKLPSNINNPFLEFSDTHTSIIRSSKSPWLIVPDCSGRLTSDFEYVRRVGNGDFGSVFLCIGKLDRCLYAIKEISRIITGEEKLKRAMRECWALSTIASASSQIRLHDSIESGILRIVRYFGCWVDDQKLFVQTEFCEGGNLSSQLINSPNSFTEGRIRRIMYQISSALAVCHQLGICHLDVKPANILETSIGSEKFKLCDFGLAYPVYNLSVTSESPECGDSRYLSPEMLAKDHISGDVLLKSDIFSLGASMIELAVGKPLISPIRSIKFVEHEVLNGLNISVHLRELLAKMVHVDPSLRPSAQDVLHILSHSGNQQVEGISC